MRQLIILRHAEAETKGGKPDRDRVLTQEGRAEAKRIGESLNASGHVPERIIISPSARTRETCELVCEAFRQKPEIIVEDRLYGFGDVTPYLTTLAEHAGDARCVIIVGHNPSVHSLALWLAGDAEALGGFPTAAAAVIKLPGDDWPEIRAGEGRLAAFLLP